MPRGKKELAELIIPICARFKRDPYFRTCFTKASLQLPHPTELRWWHPRLLVVV